MRQGHSPPSPCCCPFSVLKACLKNIPDGHFSRYLSPSFDRYLRLQRLEQYSIITCPHCSVKIPVHKKSRKKQRIYCALFFSGYKNFIIIHLYGSRRIFMRTSSAASANYKASSHLRWASPYNIILLTPIPRPPGPMWQLTESDSGSYVTS